MRVLAAILSIMLALLTITPAFASAADSDRVAYIKDGDVWWRPVDGGPAHRLTRGGGYAAPRWSPEGRWILVRKGKAFRVVETDGAREHPLPVTGTLVWNPHVDVLAYMNEAGEIGRIEPHQPDKPRVILPAATGERRRGLIWSPDGRRLAFAVERGAPPGRGYAAIWEIAVALEQNRELYATRDKPSPCLYPAAWAATGQILFWAAPGCSASLMADGVPLMAVPPGGGKADDIISEMLAYRGFLALRGARLAAVIGNSRMSWANKHVRVIDLATGNERAISPPDQAALSPDWAPDGGRLAYTASPDAGNIGGGEAARRVIYSRRIWLSAADGSWRRQVTQNSGYRDEAPAWLPGGERLLFVRVDEQGRTGLWTVSASGGPPVHLTDVDGPPGRDAWFGYYGWYDYASLFDLLSRARILSATLGDTRSPLRKRPPA